MYEFIGQAWIQQSQEIFTRRFTAGTFTMLAESELDHHADVGFPTTVAAP